MVGKTAKPIGNLRYLYIGTSNAKRDIEYYTKVLRAEKIWDRTRCGAKVAALRVGTGPLILLADHRPAPSCILIYEVEDLAGVSDSLREKGWKPEGDPFEVPDGPCYRFNDPSGNPFALLQIVRPNIFRTKA